jgi:hypothetical protein
LNEIRVGSGASVERNPVSILVYYFIQIIRYMFLSYDHLQAEIYASEINMTEVVEKYLCPEALQSI